MKSKRFIYIIIVSLICLLGLQSVWLYNTFNLERSKTQEGIKTAFIDALRMELAERMNRIESHFKSQGVESLELDTYTFEMDSSLFDSGNVMPMEFIAMQHITHHQLDYPLDVPLLDTIYSLQLARMNLSPSYNIVYTDSLGDVLASTHPEVTDGFRTGAVPVVDRNRIQAVVQLSAPAIFRNMAGVLVVSIFIIVLIVGCAVYEMRTFITQQQLSLMRDNFMYALTHDMKTPLGTIHTVLDQSAKGLLDANPEMRTKFNQIGLEQVTNLQALVNQILTIAQMEQRKLSVHKQPIDLQAMIASLINKFSVNSTKQVTFDTQIDTGTTTVQADPLYLENAISNLIDNAIKYSAAQVNIRTQVSVNGNQLYIRVADNGFGISEADRKRIFDRFERGAELKRRSASGFGIGLNYVKTVVEAHGGGITLTSQEGVGSEFVITIPVE